MGRLMIVEPLAFTTTGTAGVQPAALGTPDPKEVWAAPNAAGGAILIDLGQVRTVDTFFLGFSNANLNSEWSVQQTNSAFVDIGAVTVNLAMRSADAATARTHSLARLAAPVTGRYFKLYVNTKSELTLYAGVLVVGLSIVPEWDKEWGSGRRLIDTGAATALIGGGYGVQQGTRKPGYTFTLGDLTDAEVEKLWAMALRKGETNPVLVVEQYDATENRQEKIHYGLFQRFEPYERRNPNETKWAMEIHEWV